jgi:hypothetical protein
MAKLTLARILRGSGKRVVEDALALVGSARLEDANGKVLLGDTDAVGDRHPIGELGAVVGAPGAERVARLVAHLLEREEEKLALADETLGRYKELTLLYDISDKLSRVIDVDEVCELVVGEAARFLGASSASILLVDPRREALEPIASTNMRAPSIAATSGIEGRVLRTGRAEFVEDLTTTDERREPGVAALMVAPLRSGETVFGLLRVANHQAAAWTAGHLKLVTSLAGNAAAAISHAMLHQQRLRQQALRHQIERFASPWVLDAAFGTRKARSIATLLCDVGDLARFVASDPESLMALVRHVTTSTLAALMAEGATAQLSQSELILGFFDSPHAAVRAATTIVRTLDRQDVRSPGLAITHAELPDQEPLESFYAAVGSAANLQRSADGRILVDASIASALAGTNHTVIEYAGDVAGVHGKVYEVRA